MDNSRDLRDFFRMGLFHWFGRRRRQPRPRRIGYSPAVGKSGDLDWDDLRHFLAAIRAGTLAGAARALGVKHSTIGRRLTELERALGGALFARRPDGLRLTLLGEKLVPLAQEVERATQALQSQAKSETSTVRLAVPSGFVPQFTPHLERLRGNHPEISLEFLSGSRKVDLNKGEADLALRVGAAGDENLVVRKVGEVGWSLYASPEYLARHKAPVDPRRLAGHQVLGFDKSLAGLPGAQWLAEHGKGATIALLHRELADMAAAAVGGAGLALLPCVFAEDYPRLKRLTPEVLGRQPLSLVYRREAKLSKPVEIVAGFVVQVMRERAKLMRG